MIISKAAKPQVEGAENGWYDRASLDFFLAGLLPPLLQDALSPASKLAKGLEWADPIGFGVGTAADLIAYTNNLRKGEGSPNSITGSKFLINTTIGYIGWKLCPELGIIYSGGVASISDKTHAKDSLA